MLADIHRNRKSVTGTVFACAMEAMTENPGTAEHGAAEHSAAGHDALEYGTGEDRAKRPRSALPGTEENDTRKSDVAIPLVLVPAAGSETTELLDRGQAEALGKQLQAMAGRQAILDHDFCGLVDRFDAGRGAGFYDGVKSTAHFLSWACSMSPGVAREHVRVARGLREMPRVDALFGQGRLTYSKVRELTRIAGTVDEAQLCELALMMTASQLARTVSSFRLAAGSRIKALPARGYSSQPMPGGMVRISVVLPAEDAGVIDAAVEAACRAAQPMPDSPTPDTPTLPGQETPGQETAGQPFARADRVQALVDVASAYLDAAPTEPADDHTVVLVHVDARTLDVPAGTSSPAIRTPATDETDRKSVPAGTLFDPPRGDQDIPDDIRAGMCVVDGEGAIEPQTAQRLMCTATVQGILTGRDGQVLALGRTRRLASRAQRRALRIRDGQICQFPGCSCTTHLDAHHVVPWSHGGATDLGNLISLCRRHHTLVHEGGVGIIASRPGAAQRWEFWMPEGRRVDAEGYRGYGDPEDMTSILAMRAKGVSFPRPDAVFPVGGGAGFDLFRCVEALFAMMPERDAA